MVKKIDAPKLAVASLRENCHSAGEKENLTRRRTLADPRASVHAGRMQGSRTASGSPSASPSARPLGMGSKTF
jgi:hypothetical protein